MKVVGYQAKLGNALPNRFFIKSEEGIERCILLQGKAPEGDNISAYHDWERWSKEQVQELLGYSLKSLYPANWSKSLAAEEEEEVETVQGNNKKTKQNEK